MRPSEISLSQAPPLSSDAAVRRRFMEMDEPLPGNLRFGLASARSGGRTWRRTSQRKQS